MKPLQQRAADKNHLNNGRTSLHRSMQDWYPYPGGFNQSFKIKAAIQKIYIKEKLKKESH